MRPRPWAAAWPLAAGISAARQERWFGEVDYTGPCDPARDFDCDGWFDAHDDCPGTFDPDQPEGAPCSPVVLPRQPSGHALARNPGRLDAVWAGLDGGIGAGWSDAAVNGGAWVRPVPLTPPGNAAPRSRVAVVARTPTHMDVFWVGPDGGIGSAAWDADGGWTAPYPVAPPGAASL